MNKIDTDQDQTVAAKRRGGGRPPESISEDVRGQILEEAGSLFARQGFAATSIRQIADAVGVNPAMVHYYFKNKASLLQAVLEQVMIPMADAIAELAAKDESPATEFVALMHGLFKEHPRLPQLLAREVLLPGGVMQAYFIEHLAPRLGGALPGLLEREQQAGRIRQDADPQIDSLLILAISFFPFIVRNLAEQALDIQFDEPGLAKLTHHTNRLLQRGLQP